MAIETKEQPLFLHTEMDSKAIWFKSGKMHSNWKKTTIWNISFCLFLPKKKIIMEWDKQWKLHCNADRFIDNLVWDNQLRVYMILYNQFEGEGYKVWCNLSYTQTWHIFFLVFFSKHLSSTSVNWQNPEITDPVQIFQSPSIIWQPNTFEKR